MKWNEKNFHTCICSRFITCDAHLLIHIEAILLILIEYALGYPFCWWRLSQMIQQFSPAWFGYASNVLLFHSGCKFLLILAVFFLICLRSVFFSKVFEFFSTSVTSSSCESWSSTASISLSVWRMSTSPLHLFVIEQPSWWNFWQNIWRQKHFTAICQGTMSYASSWERCEAGDGGIPVGLQCKWSQ